jgi:FKBP-type peptidyl-prolyl cis-trans isomerase FkpA
MKRIPKTAALLALSSVIMAGSFTQALAQTKTKTKTKSKEVPATPKEKKSTAGFATLEGGLKYKIIKHGTGKKKVQIGDRVQMNVHVHIGDSVVFDSRKMYNNRPVPFPIQAPKVKGELVEGLMMLAEGDSAVFMIPVDTLKKQGTPLPPWVKEGQMMEYDVEMVTVRTEAEEKKYNEEMGAKQKGVDDKILTEYFEKNHIKAQKTASGLYYVIHTEGDGPNIKPGDKASVNYTGKFMDGRKFDSNVDSAFHHVMPFELEVGRGKVIKGWDEGLQLLKKGSKATLYIPSPLAYGAQDQRGIPANSILVFDVEITNIVDAETARKQDEEHQKQAMESQKEASQHAEKQKGVDDQVLQDYFAKNNIHPEKTPSGLYYTISQKGLGNQAKPGNKVTMNYTGKLLDGKVFDSNTDPKFGHVQPFSFNLGMGQVIRGWDEGVQLLKLGSKATFYIPSTLAYGAQGAGGAIPPNANLIFDVEVLGIDKK